MKTDHQAAGGLTLVELVITVAVFAVVTAAGLIFIRGAYEAQRFSLEDARAINEARRGLKGMLAELREARSGEDGAYILNKADDQEIIFYGDVDKDNSVERVRYYLSGTNLMRGVIEPQATSPVYPPDLEQINIISQFINNDETPIFTYYNGDWPGDAVSNPLATPARLTETKLIQLQLKVNQDPQRAPVDYVLTGSVQMRNLKTNL